jgi:Tol biopolymer transport system component
VAIEAGQQLLHYRLTEKIGEGGMGVVWKATDTTLDREVALKILPEAFAGEADRLGRFEREAKLLASLNHPNIAVLHGLHEHEGVRFLTMELVPGEDLAQRLLRGPVPVDETLKYARCIAEALEVAHERGVVHRDLKPANIRVTPDGEVKVLDFGLAKAYEPDPASGGRSLSMSPTLTSAGTAHGVILGTASYMSPEQARGRPVDRRADIWAFGCVIYELLTGRRAFEGETVSDTLAELLKTDPDLDRLPAETPSRLRRLFERCTRKDPRSRLRDIGDARVALEEIIDNPEEPIAAAAASTGEAERMQRGPLRRLLPWFAGGALLAAGLAAGFFGREATLEKRVLHTSILPPADVAIHLYYGDPGVPTLSPDGRMIVFTGRGEDQKMRLYVRSLDASEATVLEGTEGGHYPFWSADGRYIGYFEQAGASLKKVPVTGGPTVAVAEASNGKGGSWNRHGDILYTPTSNSGIFTVRETGGPPRQVTTIDFDRGEDSHRHPFFLPDGRHFLYLVRLGGESGSGNEIRLASLDGKMDRELFPSDAAATYASGRILYQVANVLMSRPFDGGALKLTGEAAPLIDGVYNLRGAAKGSFSASTEGTLTYVGDVEESADRLVWREADGTIGDAFGDEALYRHVVLSPDGSKALVIISDPASAEDDLWIYDVQQGTRSRFTFETLTDWGAAWSPDGDIIYYSSFIDGLFKVMAGSVDGSEEPRLLYESKNPVLVKEATPDGRYLVMDHVPVDGSWSCMQLPLGDHAQPRELEPLVQTESVDVDCSVSPDGKWLAWESMEGGETQVYVKPYSGAGRKWQISLDSGNNPFWSRDGRKVFFHDRRNVLEVEVVTRDGRLAPQPPKLLFDASDVNLEAIRSVAPDGRFLTIKAGEADRVTPVELVVNWDAAGN